MILYIWKIIHGLVPDVGLNYAPTNSNDTIRLKLPNLKGPRHIQKLMESSILYHGARLYNLLPDELRTTNSPDNKPVTLDTFKRQLDTFLWRIPDEPGATKGDRGRAAETNSILHQLAYIAPPHKVTKENRENVNSNTTCTTNLRHTNRKRGNNFGNQSDAQRKRMLTAPTRWET